MARAFEDALRELRLSNREDPAALAIAKLIIELAKHGERDPVRTDATLFQEPSAGNSVRLCG